MTISSIPPSLAALLASVRPAAPETTSATTISATGAGATAPKFTPAQDVENFVAQVESQTISELLGGGDASSSAGMSNTGISNTGMSNTGMSNTGGLASLLGGASAGGSATDLASLLGGSTASPSSTDLTGLASIASAYDFASRLSSLGTNPFDQSSWDANSTGSTLDTSA
jgi:hypothetical protein